MNPDLEKIPQSWALYKEVQEYYEKGMRVPDDVTLLWCDDNWGNIRRLPTAEERKRRGGAGIYYHFDYVGGPRSYKWINTNPIPKVWEQMNLAYEYGADANLDRECRRPEAHGIPDGIFSDVCEGSTAMAERKTSGIYYRNGLRGSSVPRTLQRSPRSRRNTRNTTAGANRNCWSRTTYSLVDYEEADRVAAEFQSVVDQAEQIYGKLPENYRDAFFQLVLFPVKASAQVTQLYVTVGKNQLYAKQGRASTNDLAAQARALFQADAELSANYNHTLGPRKMGPHDGPDAYWVYVLERAAEEHDAGGGGTACSGRAKNGNRD